jgi:hypothetical protein
VYIKILKHIKAMSTAAQKALLAMGSSRIK